MKLSVLTSIFSFIFDLLVCSARTFFNARRLSRSCSSTCVWCNGKHQLTTAHYNFELLTSKIVICQEDGEINSYNFHIESYSKQTMAWWAYDLDHSTAEHNTHTVSFTANKNETQS